MGDVDAVVEDSRLAENHVFRPYLITLFGILPTLKPHEVGDTCAIRKMSDDTLLTWSHLEGLETEDMTHDLHEGHVASQFVDSIDF